MRCRQYRARHRRSALPEVVQGMNDPQKGACVRAGAQSTNTFWASPVSPNVE
jgi:hypothetical protein